MVGLTLAAPLASAAVHIANELQHHLAGSRSPGDDLSRVGVGIEPGPQ